MYISQDNNYFEKNLVCLIVTLHFVRKHPMFIVYYVILEMNISLSQKTITIIELIFIAYSCILKSTLLLFDKMYF